LPTAGKPTAPVEEGRGAWSGVERARGDTRGNPARGWRATEADRVDEGPGCRLEEGHRAWSEETGAGRSDRPDADRGGPPFDTRLHRTEPRRPWDRGGPAYDRIADPARAGSTDPDLGPSVRELRGGA
jgi:hypothetical protein